MTVSDNNTIASNAYDKTLKSALEMEKMKLIIYDLKKEIGKNALDLLKIKSLLYDFKTHFNAGTMIFVESLRDACKIMSLDNILNDTSKEIMGELKTFEEFRTKQLENLNKQLIMIDQILQLIIANPPLPVEQLRDVLYRFVGEYEVRHIIFDVSPFVSEKDDTFSQIKKFISLKIADLTENWVPAVCYLSAIDILVNKKRKQLGLTYPVESREIGTPFEQKYKELIAEMESKGIKFSEIMKPVPNAFWNIRTKVIHYGVVPSPKELDMIITNSQEIFDMLSQ